MLEIVFPDGYQRPPSPCDLIASGAVSKRNAGAAQQQPQAAWSRPMNAPASSPAAARHPGWSAQASAQGVGQGFGQGSGGGAYSQQDYGWGAQPLAPGEDKMPKFARNEFPAAVDPENPLRYSGSGKLMGRPSTLAAIPAASGAFAPEPWRAPQQLVARRVPGVAAMPYERWGFALLPGGNGLQTPDAPHSANKAPAGTLWAAEQATGSGANQVGAAGALADPSRAAAQLLGMGRVPSPSAMRVGGQGYFRAAEADIEDQDESVFPQSSMRPTFAGVDVDPAPTGSIEAEPPLAIERPDFEPGYSAPFLNEGAGEDHSALEPSIGAELAKKAAQIFRNHRSLGQDHAAPQAISGLEDIEDTSSISPPHDPAQPASPPSISSSGQ